MNNLFVLRNVPYFRKTKGVQRVRVKVQFTAILYSVTLWNVHSGVRGVKFKKRTKNYTSVLVKNRRR